MNRVLRSVSISDEPVTISILSENSETEAFGGGGEAEAPDEPTAEDEDPSSEDEGASSQSETEDSEQPEESEESEQSEEQADAVPEPPEGDDETGEIDGDQLIGLEEVAESQLEEPEPEAQPASAMDIEKQVEARLEEFEARFQQEKEDAYHAGFEDGTNEGTKQGLAQSTDEIERFSDLVASLPVQWKDAVKNYDAAVLDLAIHLARRIVGSAAEIDESIILQAVHDCLGYVEDKTKVIIRVNPDDLEAVRRHRNDWLESLESIDHLLIESDPTVTRGGCVVETPIGDVDAQIEERLDRVRNALLEDLRKDTGETQ
ncbi:MAG: hypothetical protein CME26_14085 [Gemmatimonadetes bacterium]|nr:hypothetical protein [Gemmatimonadota bacterium]|tara:strand:+ start:12221 stop:13171 length:951 start_codon:yes stop_codon:yes gene_type:complete